MCNSFSWVHRLIIDIFAFQLLVYAPNSSSEWLSANIHKKEVAKLSTKDMSSNDIAVRYLGRALIALIVSIVICFLASLSYNTYIKWSQKEIEVRAENSNSHLNEIQ